MPVVRGSRIKILVADDHSIFIEGLMRLLSEKYELVGAVSDGRSLVKAAKDTSPHVIVTDISMPLLNGLDASRLVLSQTPQTKIIFLTMHADRYFITEAFRAGAAGYVLKQSAGDELLAAIDEVMAGRRYLSSQVADEALAFVLNDDLETEFRPTLRQREVLQLIAEGKQMKEIAAILDISRRTAESHKYGMMRTLNINSNAELIQYAIKIGLVSI